MSENAIYGIMAALLMVGNGIALAFAGVTSGVLL